MVEEGEKRDLELDFKINAWVEHIPWNFEIPGHFKM